MIGNNSQYVELRDGNRWVVLQNQIDTATNQTNMSAYKWNLSIYIYKADDTNAATQPMPQVAGN